MSFLLATAETGNPLVDWLAQGGSIGILAVVVVLFLRGKIVPGSELEKVRAERDRAMDLVFQLAQTARRAVEVGEQSKETP